MDFENQHRTIPVSAGIDFARRFIGVELARIGGSRLQQRGKLFGCPITVAVDDHKYFHLARVSLLIGILGTADYVFLRIKAIRLQTATTSPFCFTA